MSNRDYHPPRIQTIIIAGVIFMASLGMLWTLRSSIKQVGDIFLYLPSKMGLVERVAPEEIHIVDLNTASPTSIELTKPGKYIVFTDSYYLLRDSARSNAYDKARLEVISHITGEALNVVTVDRGVRPYDTPLAAGRPIFAFEVSASGSYEIMLLESLNTSVAIVPDYTSGKEPIIGLAFVVQLILLLAPFGIIYYRRHQRYQARIQNIRKPQIQRQTKGQAFWTAEIQKGQNETQKKQ
jgi:hypothetical protein